MVLTGLSSQQAQQRLKQYGRNETAIKKPSFLTTVWHWLASPITLMLGAAAALSFYSHRLFDFYFILGLAALNTIVTAAQKHKADSAVAQLQSKLTVKAKVLRDSQWLWLDAPLLVPGDIVAVGIGNILPADLALIEAHNLSVNEAALTGESLPQAKLAGNKAFAGSFVTTGSAYAEVTATSSQTAYGKALLAAEQSSKRSLLEKDILTITYLLSGLSLLAVTFITLVLLAQHLPAAEILRLDLSLLIAGVPVSLPTVMTIIIGLGVMELAAKNAIVRRLAALENLANVSLLLSDKTGTLTQNLISVEQIIPFDGFTENQLMSFALATTDKTAGNNPIDQAIIKQSGKLGIAMPSHVKGLIPADSERKHATVRLKWDGEDFLVAVGAPQVIAKLCVLPASQAANFDNQVKSAAENGYRVLAIAAKAKVVEEKNLRLVGLILLSDTPQADAADVISYLGAEGIEVKMITGDNLAISQRIAAELGLKGRVEPREHLQNVNYGQIPKSWWAQRAGFAEILPDDKYRLTEAAKHNYITAVTGDGVNDLPALAAADVGIAVKNAVDALRSTADIILLSEGISVIKEALIEARKIFERLYSYSVYRISESFRLIVTIAFLGFVVHSYPLTPIQLILIAFLNDLPVIALAYNRVKVAHKPSRSQSKRRLYRGILHGSIGVMSSLTMYFVLANVLHLPLAAIQTTYFLKLSVSGHMLIYVAHTDERWFNFLPSIPVVLATTLTQLFASLLAGIGLFMAPISLGLIGFVWLWSFGWMQISDVAKALVPKK